jgi:molybdate transport system substrate-binding protein
VITRTLLPMASALLGALVIAMGAGPGAAAPSSAPLGPVQVSPLCEPASTPTLRPSVARDPVGTPTVSVAAASDLRFAMDDLVAAYRVLYPEQTIGVTYGSSGNFFAQISQGAPFDVYFSADIEYPIALEEAGLAAPDSTRRYAEGRIVVWVRDVSPIDVEGLGIGAVLDPAAERVAIANPEHAPYGRAARSAMEAAGVWERSESRIVLGENISQAAQFVASGAADIGILALSLALAPPLCLEGRYALVPQGLHPPIDQGALVLADAAHPEAAEAFLDFVLGPRGREALDRYGFLLPEV